MIDVLCQIIFIISVLCIVTWLVVSLISTSQMSETSLSPAVAIEIPAHTALIISVWRITIEGWTRRVREGEYLHRICLCGCLFSATYQLHQCAWGQLCYHLTYTLCKSILILLLFLIDHQCTQCLPLGVSCIVNCSVLLFLFRE